MWKLIIAEFQKENCHNHRENYSNCTVCKRLDSWPITFNDGKRCRFFLCLILPPLHTSSCQKILQVHIYVKMFWQMLKTQWSLDDLAADDHFNSALLSNYGVMWVILSEHVDSCCLLIHSKQTQLGVGRQCTASRDRESGSFTQSPLMCSFKKTLSFTLGSPASSLCSLVCTHLSDGANKRKQRESASK